MSCDNRRDCSCTYPCSRHGKCCECIAFHKQYDEVPGCLFSKQGELSYDRSIKNLARDHNVL